MINFQVLQGEHPKATKNRLLGTFVLRNLPRKRAGEVNIIVKYEVDVNGILKCSAVEESTGTTEGITIKSVKGKDCN